jgi:hypothetical protein
MSDTESDYDEDDNYEEEEEEEDNLNNANNNLLNGIQNEKVIEFIGSINGKAGWIKCLYCDRFHPLSMHLTGMEYCGHCWGWLNSNQMDLEKGIYKGQNPISEIKNYLKETFKLHDPTKCVNVECIYNKIINLEKNKKLHIDFCVELGFVKPPEPSIINETSNKTSNNSTNKLNYNINKKVSSRINYKLSHITI